MTDEELYVAAVTAGRPLWIVVKGICNVYERTKTLSPRQREILERFIHATETIT